MSDALFETFHFLKHKINGKWRHGVHSPLVFHLTSEILRKDRMFSDFKPLDELRSELLRNNTTLRIEDFGAGTRGKQSETRQVKSIAQKAVAPKVQAEALYKLVNYFQPQSILEFGTSLGLTTSYIAKAAPQSEVITVEGSKEIADFATTLFAKQQIRNVRVVHQKFDEFITNDLDKEKKFDLIYIDGNHTYEATAKYFLYLLNHVNENTWFVFDDIYWSRGMNRAWLEIINHESVSLSMDFFHFGVIMLQPRMTKEHFKLNGLLSF